QPRFRRDWSSDVVLFRSLFEAIANAMLGQNIEGISGIALDLAPKLTDINARIVYIINVLASPYLFKQFTLGNDSSGVFHQDCQQLKFCRRKMHFTVVHVNVTTMQINAEIAVVITLLAFAHMHAGT